MYKLAFAILASTLAHAEAKTEVYGKFTADQAPIVELSKAIAEYKEGPEALIHTQGTVKKVCEKEGCWMTLDDQGKSVRVIFKGHSFFVGKNLEGKKVVTEGVMQKKVQSVEQQKHLLKDAGAKEAEIAKVKAPIETYVFEATAVKTI
jgi:hypothetical protein